MKETNLKLKRFSRVQLFLMTALMTLFSITAFAADKQSKVKVAKNAPVFSKFVYQGEDEVYKNNPLKADEFYNPILQGCYPDPSITRKGIIEKSNCTKVRKQIVHENNHAQFVYQFIHSIQT